MDRDDHAWDRGGDGYILTIAGGRAVGGGDGPSKNVFRPGAPGEAGDKGGHSGIEQQGDEKRGPEAGLFLIRADWFCFHGLGTWDSEVSM